MEADYILLIQLEDEGLEGYDDKVEKIAAKYDLEVGGAGTELATYKRDYSLFGDKFLTEEQVESLKNDIIKAGLKFISLHLASEDQYRKIAKDDKKKEEEVKPTYRELGKKPEEIDYPETIPEITDVPKHLLDKIRQGIDNVAKFEAQADRIKELELEKLGYRKEMEDVDRNTEELFNFLKKLKPQMMMVEDKIIAIRDLIKEKPETYTPSQKLKKLLAKYGKEAEEFLDRSEKQLGKYEEIIKELVLIEASDKVKEKTRSGSTEVVASVWDKIKGFFSDTLSGLKEWLSSITEMNDDLSEIITELD
jgi:hypothetical protein